MLTKDQVSDLRSLHERIVVCALANERGISDLMFAQKQLDAFLWQLEHPAKEEASHEQ